MKKVKESLKYVTKKAPIFHMSIIYLVVLYYSRLLKYQEF